MCFAIRFRKNKPRRILVVAQANVASTAGGSITVFFHFCRLLSDLGYEVTGSCFSEDPRRPSSLDERVHFVNLHYLYGKRKNYDKAYNRFVGEWRPDLIVFFYPHYCLEMRLSRRFNKIPRIIMFHSRPDFLFSQVEDFPQKLRPFYVNTCSQVLFESYRGLLPDYIRDGEVHVIANGIKQFPERAEDEGEHKRIVYFSRVDSLKGVDLLIESMVAVKQKHPDWRVDIYGDIEPEEYAGELREAIREKGLTEQICLKGRSSRGIEETLSDYDFSVFPSRVEGFSIGLGETLSMGLATIGYRFCSGVNEMIIDGVNGYLCDNPEEFAQAMIRLIEKPEERTEMGRKARESMRQYAPELIDEKWAGLVKSILGE